MMQQAAENSLKGCILHSAKIDQDCGCVEEEWDTPVGFMFMHMLPDNTGELHFDNGDMDWEVTIAGDSEQDLRQKILQYINSLPVLDI